MEFYELLNYINATFFPRTGDGVGQSLYDSQYLYLGRLYKTEDGYEYLLFVGQPDGNFLYIKSEEM